MYASTTPHIHSATAGRLPSEVLSRHSRVSAGHHGDGGDISSTLCCQQVHYLRYGHRLNRPTDMGRCHGSWECARSMQFRTLSTRAQITAASNYLPVHLCQFTSACHHLNVQITINTANNSLKCIQVVTMKVPAKDIM